MVIVAPWCRGCCAAPFPRCGRVQCCEYWERLARHNGIGIVEVRGLKHSYLGVDPSCPPVFVIAAELRGAAREREMLLLLGRLSRATLTVSAMHQIIGGIVQAARVQVGTAA